VSRLRITVRARGVQVNGQANWPDMVLLWGGESLTTWTLDSTEYRLYEHTFSTSGGVKTVELSLANDPGGIGDVDIVVDYVDITFCNPSDFNFDGMVNAADLAILLGAWGPCDKGDPCLPDLNGDGMVTAADLAILLGSWGPCQ